MANTFSLKLGNTDVTLTKSDRWIAVKEVPGARAEAIAMAATEVDASLEAVPSIGGFQLLRVDSASAESALDDLRKAAPIGVGTHVFHTSADGVPFVPTGQLYVECRPDALPEECQAALEEQGLEIIEARDARTFIAQVTPLSPNPVKVAAALQANPIIEVAEPDLASPGKLHATFVLPNDPRIVDQWHLRNTGNHRGTTVGFVAGADARVIDAWEDNESLGSPNVIVCVIDDGFDLLHPDLTGDWKIVAKKDFTRNSADPLPDPQQQDWHGTACAGVAVGNADGTGIAGAAPRCRLMPVRWGVDLADQQVENWFDYARQQGAWVVSCSWGAAAANFPLSTRKARAIARCAKQGRNGLGTVICFAAGNENRDVNDPANDSVNGFAIHPDVVAVSASTSRDQRSNYSNFGDAIFVCAPSSGAGGWRITTSDVMGQYTRGNQTFEAGYSAGAYTDDFGGTSSACPLVAGVCGLILSIRPDLTADDVKLVIRSTARKIGGAAAYDSNGHSRQFGYGCVDAARALDAVREQAADTFWGEKGHGINNRVAVDAVPLPLGAFYRKNRDLIEELAMAADDAKKTDPDERPRHFIDLDEYGKPPFDELPRARDKAEKKFGVKTVLDRGIVPWVIAARYKELVSRFKAGDFNGVVEVSAWLGHYVGDVHVPLHTTSNHDGQLTKQKGLHSYFESQVVKAITAADIKPPAAAKIAASVIDLAFEWALESHAHVATIVAADAANGGKTGQRNLKQFSKVAKPIAIERLTKGCHRLASLWYSAWIEAGKPALP